MSHFAADPSERRLRTLVVAVIMAPLVIVATLLVWLLPARLDAIAVETFDERGRAIAQVVGQAVQPGVEFEDADNVDAFLQRIATAPDLRFAVVYRADGTQLAVWGHAPSSAGHTPIAREPVLSNDDGILRVEVPVATHVGPPGALLIGLATDGLVATVRTNLRGALTAAVVVLLIGLLVSLVVGQFLVRRRRAECALHRTRESFRTLIERSPDGILVQREGRVVFANQAAGALFGQERPDALVGREYLALVHPDDRDAVAARIARARDATAALVPTEERFAREDGRIVSVEVAALSVVFEGGPAVLAIARDLTDRKAIQARLMISDRMATLGTLAAGVGHEINNPLTYLLGGLEFVVDAIDVASPPSREELPEIVEALRDALDGARRVQHIARDLKTFARGDTEAQGPLDVCATVLAALRMARAQLEPHARLVTELAPMPLVIGNEFRLGQVFLNLVVNAVQAFAEADRDQNEVKVAARRDGDDVIVSVTDNGAGIPREIRDRIFEPFFTTKAVGVGTGLGLSICQDIVVGLGGELTVDSELGRGTSFHVRLPGVPATAHVPAPGAPPRGLMKSFVASAALFVLLAAVHVNRASAQSDPPEDPPVADRPTDLPRETPIEDALSPDSDLMFRPLGGYGEITLTAPSNGDNVLDLRRIVLFVGHHFSPTWRFYSEFEQVHARVSPEDIGSFEVEQAYLDHLVRRSFNLRVGEFLVPMGIINTYHDPTEFLGVDRPLVDELVIPSTWQEVGVGIFGELTPELRYQLYALNGLNAAGLAATAPLRSAFEEGSLADAKDAGVIARVDWVPIEGATLGASAYGGTSGNSLRAVAGNVPIGMFDLDGHIRRGGLQLQAEAVMLLVGGAGAVDRALAAGTPDQVAALPVPSQAQGGYVQAGYDVLSLLGGHRGNSLVGFGRFDYVDTQARVPAGFTAKPELRRFAMIAGLVYRPLSQIAFKLDYGRHWFGAGPSYDQLAAAIAWSF